MRCAPVHSQQPTKALFHRAHTSVSSPPSVPPTPPHLRGEALLVQLLYMHRQLLEVGLQRVRQRQRGAARWASQQH